MEVGVLISAVKRKEETLTGVQRIHPNGRMSGSKTSFSRQGNYLFDAASIIQIFHEADSKSPLFLVVNKLLYTLFASCQKQAVPRLQLACCYIRWRPLTSR